MDATTQSYRVGIDIGGTKIAAGVVDVHSGRVLERARIPTTGPDDGASLIPRLHDLTTALVADAAGSCVKVSAVGVAVAELVGLDGRIDSQQIVSFTTEELQAHLSHVAPVTVVSDVQAAARAEALFGAGRPYDIFLYVSVGTGISASVVLGGAPHRGAHGHAIVLGAPSEAPGAVVESLASGPAITRTFAERTGEHQTAEVILSAARGGDAAAQAVVEEAGTNLGRAIGFAANLVDPAAVVVGGGLGSAGGCYWEHMLTGARSSIWSAKTKAAPILPAGLGEESSLVGAALSAEPTGQWSRHVAG